MNEHVKASPKEFFLNLAVFAMLYVVAYVLIVLVNNCIDYFLPDTLFGGHMSIYSMRWEIALLIVTFPGFLIVSRVLGKIYTSEPAQQKARARQWLLYLTLFVTGITMVVIIVTVVFGLLMGELTTSLALKALVVFLVSGAVFEYHRQIGSDRATLSKLGAQCLAVVSTCAVVLAIGVGIYITGSPYQERRVRLDQEKVNELSGIQNAVIRYWEEKKKLPESLTDTDIRTYVRDSESIKEYEYKILNKETFSLCAEFKTSDKQDQDVKQYGLNKWAHEAGKVCFERSVVN
ncbi:MAG: DUF5671 domain-containing protein [bacterium]|nr:DUF5671 domain-containing protein [bacterium]